MDPLGPELRRRTLIQVLRSHPRWTLRDVLSLIQSPALARAEALELGALRLGELWMDDPLALRRHLAERQEGAEFDTLVLEVLVEASPQWVGATYLRRRLGGPRWKLTGALARLWQAGEVQQTGRTSDRLYRAVVQEAS